MECDVTSRTAATSQFLRETNDMCCTPRKQMERREEVEKRVRRQKMIQYFLYLSKKFFNLIFCRSIEVYFDREVLEANLSWKADGTHKVHIKMLSVISSTECIKGWK